MKDIEEFKRSIKIMCTALVGQTVNINWTAPVVFGFRGQVYLRSGVIVFDINPDRTPDEILHAALHECGHCLAGHELPNRDMLPQYDTLERLYFCEGPLFDLTPEEHDTYGEKPEELEAENIANELDRIAREHCLDLFGNDEIENRISFLSQVWFLRQEE